jgi:hypothetical protein
MLHLGARSFLQTADGIPLNRERARPSAEATGLPLFVRSPTAQCSFNQQSVVDDFPNRIPTLCFVEPRHNPFLHPVPKQPVTWSLRSLDQALMLGEKTETSESPVGHPHYQVFGRYHACALVLAERMSLTEWVGPRFHWDRWLCPQVQLPGQDLRTQDDDGCIGQTPQRPVSERGRHLRSAVVSLN